ncbi:WD40-repeat-containing domain protein [Amanita rubescens]|nr:WD40-repeat-containing domain protein [Amanita rubescens]
MANSDSSNFLVAEAQLALEHARKIKAERTKDLGLPIQLPGKALSLHIRNGCAWIAENTHVAKKIDLESGKTLQVYKGHAGPVTCLAFCDKEKGSGDGKTLITGSWDQRINLWDTDTKELISSTNAHSDFVKALLVFPSLQLLISSSSDKTVRFWDLSKSLEPTPLTGLGSISAHTRPVECLDGVVLSDKSAVLYTADTMGVINIWDLTLEDTTPPRWISTLRTEHLYHRTKINEIIVGNDQLWTASSDESVQVMFTNPTQSKPPKPITHPTAVRAILPLSLTALADTYLVTGAGDVIRTYDISNLEEPELLGEVDAHWHDVTSIRLWLRQIKAKGGAVRVEPWVITASLDGTLRKWKLSELLDPSTLPKPAVVGPVPDRGAITEEEERELAELMDD